MRTTCTIQLSLSLSQPVYFKPSPRRIYFKSFSQPVCFKSLSKPPSNHIYTNVLFHSQSISKARTSSNIEPQLRKYVYSADYNGLFIGDPISQDSLQSDNIPVIIPDIVADIEARKLFSPLVRGNHKLVGTAKSDKRQRRD